VDMGAIEAYYAHLNETGYRPRTLASAIEISRPVNLKKCLRALEICNGLVRQVSDEAILDAKAVVGRWGLGCEPASGASLAGLKLLREQAVIAADETVVCILTGHQLKDPDVTVNYHSKGEGKWANRPVKVKDDMEEIVEAMRI